MASKRAFLVARSVDGHWQHASHTGYYFGGAGACHPLVAGMTEADHAQICRAVAWMADDAAVQSVDLTADATYRVSWI
jgi:hypothetical protein